MPVCLFPHLRTGGLSTKWDEWIMDRLWMNALGKTAFRDKTESNTGFLRGTNNKEAAHRLLGKALALGASPKQTKQNKKLINHNKQMQNPEWMQQESGKGGGVICSFRLFILPEEVLQDISSAATKTK